MQKHYFQILLLFACFINYSTSEESTTIQNIFGPFEGNDTENKVITKQIIEQTENSTGNGTTVITKRTVVYQDKDGKPVTVTKIKVSNGDKNLSTNQNRQTPIVMLSNIDNFFNHFFENVVLGTRLDSIFESIQKEQEDFIKSFFDDDWQEESNSNEKLKLENKDENKKEIKNKDEKKEIKAENSKKDKEKLKKERMEELKRKFEMIPKKITRKELLFSRVCKYIFYSIVLFAIYIIVRKFLVFLDIIDPESDGLFGGKRRGLRKPKEDEEIKLKEKEKAKTKELKSNENKQQ